jgi:hypothetical protein
MGSQKHPWGYGCWFRLTRYLPFHLAIITTQLIDRTNAVILDCHPFFTTLIILVGWVVKTAVASLVSGWVGGNEKIGEAWLAYSIP